MSIPCPLHRGYPAITTRCTRRARGSVIATGNGGSSGESPSILAKAFDVLRAFDTSRRVMTLTEISRAADLPKSTVHRLLARLVELDAVEHAGDGYRVSVSLAQLASFAPANLMRELALPHMARMHQWSGQTVALGVLRGLDVVVLEQVGLLPWHSQRVLVGARLPATTAAMGKVLLAWDPREALESLLPRPLPALTRASITDPDVLLDELRTVRAGNLATQLHETREGVAGIASAIIVHGQAVGALSLIHPASVELRPQATHALRDAAARLGVEIRSALEASGQDQRWMPGREVAPPDPDADD